jgi:hypothetical protein
MQMGGGEEGVVTSLRWQTDIKDLQLDIITIDLTTEPLDMASNLPCHLNLHRGAGWMLIWCGHNFHTHSTHSRLHTPRHSYALADLTSTATATAYSAKADPMGRDVGFSMGGGKVL